MHILVVDDHNLFLQGISTLLHKLLPAAQVDIFENVESVLRFAKANPVDLVLCDIYLPNYREQNLLELFIQEDLVVPVLLISATNDIRLVKKYLDLGAAGFVHKRVGSVELMRAIRSVMETGTFLSEDIAAQLKQLVNSGADYLSDRQKEVLQLLGEGLSNREISRRLQITESTTKSHVSALFDFFGASSRLDCVRKAIMLGELAPIEGAEANEQGR